MCAQDKTLGVTGDDRRLQEKARGGKGHAEGGGGGYHRMGGGSRPSQVADAAVCCSVSMRCADAGKGAWIQGSFRGITSRGEFNATICCPRGQGQR